MLRSAYQLRGFTIDASDGEIGSVDDVFFDDATWTVRYLVVDTGGWLSGRLVLISPASVGRVAAEGRRLSVALTRSQVEGSPDMAAHLPVSRQKEQEFFDYYGYEPYWDGPGIWGPGSHPTERPAGDLHLRSAREVTGYWIRAADGPFGHVEDLLLDDETWSIRYIVIDTRNWWPGRKVLVAPRWIEAIRWEERTVHVGQTIEAVRASPEYDPDRLIDREYEERLHRHYGRPGYWE